MTRTIKPISFLIIIYSALLFSSCSEEGVIYENNKAIENNIWKTGEPIVFEFEVNDTTSYFDFFVTVRNTEAYNWSNIYLFSDLQFPNGKTRRDTIELTLADQYGYWIGKQSGTYVTTSTKYMSHRQFPLSGTYKVFFTHAMRTEDLKEVSDIGLKIKKWKQKGK